MTQKFKFLTSDKSEHFLRVFIVSYFLIIVALPLTPKAASFFPLAAFAVTVFGWRFRKSAALPGLGAFIALSLAGACVLAPSLWSPYAQAHVGQAFVVVAYSFLALFFLSAAREMPHHAAARLLTAARAAILFACVVQANLNIFTLHGPLGQYITFTHNNDVTMMLAGFGIFLAAWTHEAHDTSHAVLYALLAALVCVTSTCLPAQLGYVAAALAWLAAYKRPRQGLLAVLCICGAVIVVTPFVMPWIIRFFESQALLAAQAETSGIRLVIWDVVSAAIRAEWFTGNGVHSIRALPLGLGGAAFGVAFAAHPHNLSLTLWHDLGIAGIAAFLLGLIVLARMTRDWSASALRIFIAMTVFVFMVMQLDYTLWHEWVLGFAALLAGLFVLARKSPDMAHKADQAST